MLTIKFIYSAPDQILGARHGSFHGGRAVQPVQPISLSPCCPCATTHTGGVAALV